MLLKWYSVDDKDIAATYNDLVFRLHCELEKFKGGNTLRIVKLQLRKKQNIEFRDAGYTFLFEDPPAWIQISWSQYVDRKVWEDILDIADRAEDILLGLEYIESEPEPEGSKAVVSPKMNMSVARAYIKALKELDYLKPIKDHQEQSLINGFYRTLTYLQGMEPIEYDLEGEELDIKLKEVELEAKMMISEPAKYFQGWKESFRAQTHDYNWLKEVQAEEERFNIHKKLFDDNRHGSFKTELFMVEDQDKLEDILEEMRLELWSTDSGKVMFGSKYVTFGDFISYYEDDKESDFIEDIQKILSAETVVIVYSAEVFEYPEEFQSTFGSIGVTGDVYIITKDENHRISLEQAGENKLNGLKRKWAKQLKNEENSN